MARAYQDAHIIDNLTSSVKALQAQTVELVKAKGLHEERITNLLRQNEQQAKQIAALETRNNANEHNTTARLQNLHLYTLHSLHSPLTPLHDLTTNIPIRKFPKHERDVKTMGAADVIQVLQALNVKTLGMSAAEKKAELRVQVGLPRDVEAAGLGGEKAEEAPQKNEKEGKPKPRVAPGSTAEKKGKVGGGAAEGVSKPGASAAAKTEAGKVLAEKKG